MEKNYKFDIIQLEVREMKEFWKTYRGPILFILIILTLILIDGIMYRLGA